MTPRQARRERREAERKTRKAEIRREKAVAAAEAAYTVAPSTRRAAVKEPASPFLAPHDDSVSPRVLANRANAQLSTGPASESGKAIVSQNNFRHGLRGAFKVLPSESQEEFDTLLENFIAEHSPANPIEAALVEKIAQHFWLSQRAILLQETCFPSSAQGDGGPLCAVEGSSAQGDGGPLCALEGSSGQLSAEQRQDLVLYLRYQTTHDRAFHKCSDELRKLRNEKRKAELGFERQRRAEAEFQRKHAVEKRTQEHHKWDLLLAQAEYENQELKNMLLETPEFRIPNRIQRIMTADRAA